MHINLELGLGLYQQAVDLSEQTLHQSQQRHVWLSAEWLMVAKNDLAYHVISTQNYVLENILGQMMTDCIKPTPFKINGFDLLVKNRDGGKSVWIGSGTHTFATWNQICTIICMYDCKPFFPINWEETCYESSESKPKLRKWANNVLKDTKLCRAEGDFKGGW